MNFRVFCAMVIVIVPMTAIVGASLYLTQWLVAALDIRDFGESNGIAFAVAIVAAPVAVWAALNVWRVREFFPSQ